MVELTSGNTGTGLAIAVSFAGVLVLGFDPLVLQHPQSLLLMLVSAFAGYSEIRAAYAHAVAEGFRFYSYGDACLLRRAGGASL